VAAMHGTDHGADAATVTSGTGRGVGSDQMVNAEGGVGGNETSNIQGGIGCEC
jgi:hypothetical protein